MLRLRCELLLLGAAILFACGCSDSPSADEQAVRQPAEARSHVEESLQAGVKHPAGSKSPAGLNRDSDPSKQVAMTGGAPGPAPSTFEPVTPGLGSGVNPYRDQAEARIAGEIAEGLKIRKTLVVWLVDQSAASSDVRDWMFKQDVNNKIVFSEIAKWASDHGKPSSALEMAVVGYGSSVNFLDELPVDPDKAISLAGTLPSEDVASPLTFTAVDHAADKFLPYRSHGYEMLMVIVANSSGHDWARLDAAIPKLRRKEVPVFGVGNAVPFYRQWHAAQFSGGPPPNLVLESFELESIDLGLPQGQSDFDLNDSGYGPFGLERLCHATHGDFLRLRTGSTSAGWTVQADGTISDEMLRTYAPDYVSPQQYQSLLADNRACQALHNAALLPRAEQVQEATLPLAFSRGKDEAALARRVGEAQKKAAEKSPEVDHIYDALVQGQADRAKITSPRWQAEFDLAMGRILAAKARIDGYNAQLAVIKQGKAFKDPKHDTWVLHPSDSISAGSALDKMAKNSTMYLNRVITEHPGTPWAEMARRELRMLPGWSWTEE